MIKFMQEEMRYLSQFISQKYNISIEDSVKDFSISSFFNALDEFIKLIKSHDYVSLRKKHRDCFEFATYQDKNDNLHPPKLSDQFSAVYKSMMQKEGGIPLSNKPYFAVITSMYIFDIIEDNYKRTYRDQNVFIRDDELRLITNYKFAYYILKGLSSVCIAFMAEYINYVGPGSNRKEIIPRSWFKSYLIKFWFNLKCRKLNRCLKLAEIYYERIKEYQYANTTEFLFKLHQNNK